MVLVGRAGPAGWRAVPLPCWLVCFLCKRTVAATAGNMTSATFCPFHPRRHAFLIQTLAPCADLPTEQREAEAEGRCRGCFAIFVAVVTTVALVRWLRCATAL